MKVANLREMVIVGGVPLSGIIDSGADITIMGETTYLYSKRSQL